MRTASPITPHDRPIDRYLNRYASDHRHPINRLIHWLCVPAIVWSVIAAIWTIPAPAALGRPGLWAGLTMALALAFYIRLSLRLALAMSVAFIVLALLAWAGYEMWGSNALLWTASGVFAVAWIGQFIGHWVEGQRPSFFTDLVYLLIGPLWLMSKLFHRLRWRY